MTTIQHLMQTGQLKVNEILAKLADTPATAAKARDRLASDLKAELDRQAAFEEQRLFPLLREHGETKDLMTRALKDGEQMRTLFGEIERSPKDGAAFGAKVAALRDLAQRRFRDDSHEILPAVVKALGDEQGGTAVGNTEAETTGPAPARRADGGEHPMTDAARQSAEVMSAGMDLARQGAPVARTATGPDAVGESQQGSPSAPALENAQNADAQDTARLAASVGSSMMALFTEQARHAMQVQTAMAAGRVRTLAEIAQLQSAFMAGSVQRMGQFNDRYRAALRGWKVVSFLPSAPFFPSNRP